ncbi:CMRF35-like molecule 8 [Phacochoerus africanus]|uniref:CMRF35-like molecule 8 n=1 Tax=Phacochoerus africanus TaxID=41426 RepID=UPI001FD8CAF4|nr:CMRF35-like molecule 8 [Phacochoerus africanus]
MAPWHWVAWLTPALLLLWLPGYLSLSGPPTVTGIEGGSLSVRCRYKEEYIDNKKYWEKLSFLPLWKKIVETRESAREVRTDGVSIRDDPANLTFTVTLERLTEEDAGTYRCGINRQFSVDSTFPVEVVVFPAPEPQSTLPTTVEISTVIPETSTLWLTTLATESTTYSASSLEEEVQPEQSQGLQVLLSLSVLLLLLLVAVSLLAWRMVRRRIKANENPELPQNPNQAAAQGENCYENLELSRWPPSGEPAPVQPTQGEVEYSVVGWPGENLHYSSVVFDSQNQDSKANGVPAQTSWEKQPLYSVIKKT